MLNQSNSFKVLMVFIEPTPYILALIRAIKLTWDSQVDAIFLRENVSQQWSLSLNEGIELAPSTYFEQLKLLWRCVFKERYTLIFVAGWSHWLSLAFIFLAKSAKIPVTIDSDTQLPIALPLWKRCIKRMLYPILFKLPDLFLPSGSRQAAYFKHYGVSSKKIVLEQMTVDTLAIQNHIGNLSEADLLRLRTSIGLKPEDFVFVFVGRLVAWKGLQELCEAFNKIAVDHVKLLILGDGPQLQCVEAVAKHNVNVIYLGRISGTALFNFYALADVCVLPAHQEPWGLVINEAMAAGKPVIVTDRVGCVDDLVIHGETGLVIKSRCVESLYTAMMFMIGSSQQRAMMSANALRHIATWTIEGEATNICHAWKTLLC